MSAFQAHVARLARAAETAAPAQESAPQPVAVPLNEAAQSLPPHIIAATDPVKLNQQAAIFRCPAWAGLPSKPYHLHCEREGVPFPALALHRFPYYLFGKSSVCDYVLEHPSVSSVHAALIFNKEHACFVLLDLGSTNGTRLQGKRVEARKPVPIAVGSILQFGYSTRTYEVRAGPATTVKRGREEEVEKEVESITTARAAAEAPPSRTAARAALKTEVAAPLTSSSSSLPLPSSSAVSATLPSAPPVATTTGSISTASASPVVVASPAAATQQSETPAPPPTPELTRAEAVVVKTDASPAVESETTAAAPPDPVHLYQLVMKHKDVDNPVSRGRNKGEVITRSKADALDMVRYILSEHLTRVPVDAALGFSPWTVEEFVAAVREYCEVSSKKKAGDLGMVAKGTFSDVIDEAAFQLRRGEVSAPVETQLGIHLLFRCD